MKKNIALLLVGIVSGYALCLTTAMCIPDDCGEYEPKHLDVTQAKRK